MILSIMAISRANVDIVLESMKNVNEEWKRILKCIYLFEALAEKSREPTS